MSGEHVWSHSYSSGNGTNTSGLQLPAAGVIQAGDKGQLEVTATNPAPVNTPSGWTYLETHTYSSSMWVYVFRRVMDGTESTSIPLSWGTGASSKISATVVIKRGVEFGPHAWIDQANLTAATVDNPTVAVDPEKEYVWSTTTTYRGSAPPTGITSPPAGTTLKNSSFGTGSGAACSAVASRDTVTTEVSTLGGGTWTWNSTGSGGRIAHMQAWVLIPETEPPVDPPPAQVSSSDRFKMDDDGFILVAHRGGNPGPEETLYAYRNSYDKNIYSGAEADLQILATGEVVFHHDDTIDRLADVSSPILTGNVSDFTLAQWRTILLRQDTGFTGNPPQPPGELLHWQQEYGPGTGRTRLLFPEIKQGTDATTIINAFIAAGLDWCTIMNGYNLADVVEAIQAGFRGCYQTNAPNFTTLQSYGVKWVSMEKSSATTAICTAAHAAGIKVIVYTVNTVSDRDAQMAKGVDGVFTNKIETLSAGLAQPNLGKIRVAGATKVRRASYVMINGSKKHIAKTRVVQNGVAKKPGTTVYS